MKPDSGGQTIIRKAALDEIEAFYSVRLTHYACEHNGKVIAMGTLTRAAGRLWGFFTVKDDPSPREARAILYATMRGLRRIREPVYITTGEGVHDRAIKLVRLLGFISTGEIRNGHQVWISRHLAVDEADPTDRAKEAA